jgi:hypothetical protein
LREIMEKCVTEKSKWMFQNTILKLL